jgi:uncharacterized protein (TIGR03437 family)
MVVIFGSGMGPSGVVTSQLDKQGRIASTLSQVQVLFDGNPAPLIYVSAKQISAMVPYGVTGKSSTQIQVVYQDSTSDLFEKPIAPSAPGIFTADSSGRGQGAMTNSDGSYNTSSNPATPGSYVTLYLTGEGQTDPSGSDGNIATSTANVALPVTVLIAGRTAQLLYAGSAPGNVNGFAQINAVIPADLPYGGNLPLVVKTGGVASQSDVTLAVSGPPAPIPGVPQGLSASSNASGQIVLAWTPADGLAARFHVERQIAAAAPFTEIAVVPVPAATFTDTGVTAGISYQYRARAENDYGFSAYSAVATGTIPAAQLTPPSNVQAASASQTQINLTWATANTNATRFHIERKSGATGAYAEITAVPSTATGYQDITVQPSTTYTYRIRSEGATGGMSSYSNEPSATTPALPLPPAPSLQGTATSASQVHLSWVTAATGIVRFRVERRTTTGTYSEISQPSAIGTSFDDSGLAASTAYLYRMRVETASGVSAYSNEVTVTTLAPPLPPAPTLQGTATSASQAHLSWSTTATGIVLFSVERRTTTGGYSQISQPAATSALFDDSGLTAWTTYLYRMRVQTGAGFSPYSNEVTVTTLQALPAPPTNLQATASSSNQVNLTWTNNAPDATAIRVESQPAGSAPFTDIGAAATLTSTGITNLQANTTYSFRVRAQNAAGYSAYSNVEAATTLPIPITVFLIHGIGGTSSDSAKLAQTLADPVFGLDRSRFTIDSNFTWWCATASLSQCTAWGCSIEEGAQELSAYINAHSNGDVVLIGHSMGGLLARDMMLNNRNQVLTNHRVRALVTLGTPNVGYPFVADLDDKVARAVLVPLCPILGTEMWSDYRTKQAQNVVLESSYLLGLNQRWGATSISGGLPAWLAASGTFCKDPTRSIFNPVGCTDNSPSSDGVVCDQSARFLLSVPANTPTSTWRSDFYAHTSSLFGTRYVSGPTLLCSTQSLFTDYFPLYDPPASSSLIAAIRSLLNGIH